MLPREALLDELPRCDVVVLAAPATPETAAFVDDRFLAAMASDSVLVNVARGALRVLRSSLPYVARVTNRAPAVGGVDGESVENARVRGPLTLRTLHRAVVPRDYEQLAREVAPEAARVHCVRAGEQESEALRLLVVPPLLPKKRRRRRSRRRCVLYAT